MKNKLDFLKDSMPNENINFFLMSIGILFYILMLILAVFFGSIPFVLFLALIALFITNRS